MTSIIKSSTIFLAAALFLGSCVPTRKFKASQEALQSVRNDSASLAAEVSNLESNVSQLKGQINDLTGQVNDLTNKAGLLSTDAANKASQLNKSQQELADQQKRLEQLQALMDQQKKATQEIRKKMAGGYSCLQLECVNEPKADESKILVFTIDPQTDLDTFRQFSVHGKLNIYEAYYENCEFAYILEFFVKNEYAGDVLQQLKILTDFAEAGIYKECTA